MFKRGYIFQAIILMHFWVYIYVYIIYLFIFGAN